MEKGLENTLKAVIKASYTNEFALGAQCFLKRKEQMVSLTWYH